MRLNGSLTCVFKVESEKWAGKKNSKLKQNLAQSDKTTVGQTECQMGEMSQA